MWNSVRKGPAWKLLGAGVGVVLLYLCVVSGYHRLPMLSAQTYSIGPGLSTRQKIGAESLERQLGLQAPYGRGITFGHVEGNPGDYMPNTSDEAFEGVYFKPRSGRSKVNRHAHSTAKVLYGRQGLTPGVRDVNFYTTTHWMGSGSLNAGSMKPPFSDGCQVLTHSWIGSPSPFARDVLRRVDYLVDHHDVIAVVGVNNGAHSPVPALLASAYNVIAVGVTSGDSSGGYTTFEGAGRCKPDIVAPKSRTSFSTPVVAAIAARLLETAHSMTGIEAAQRSEVIKAVLMAGAKKPKRWARQAGKPLDEHLGAGTVRLDRSYAILTSGPQAPGTIMHRAGWDFRSLPLKGHDDYLVDSLHDTGEVSIMLVWNRRIDGRSLANLITKKERWLNFPRLADFDLRLVHLDDQGEKQVVEESSSTVDNVEHIYQKKLPAGRYLIEVTRIYLYGL